MKLNSRIYVFVQSIKKRIPSSVLRKLAPIAHSVRHVIERKKYAKRTALYFKKPTEKQRIILFFSPEHGNLGDHAIAEAEKAFFRDSLPGVPIVEISYNHYFYDAPGISQHITAHDILVTNGGGYLGTLWFHDELMVRDIIQHFPNNKIIILPQTMYFEPDKQGQQQLAISQKIYSAHPHLIFCAREQQTFQFVKEQRLLADMRNCYLIPDLVTYLDQSQEPTTRTGIMLCLRKDKESILMPELKNEIARYGTVAGEPLQHTDTVLPYPVTFDARPDALQAKFDEFRHVKLVITDRLHGMLFAAMTGTPCIALDNKSGKVKGSYQLISHLDYVRLVNDPEHIILQATNLITYGSCRYDNSPLQVYYDQLKTIVREGHDRS